MGIAIAILAFLPVVDTSVFRSTFFKPLNLWFFWFFFCDSLSLGWIGQEIVESPFIEMANFVTFSFFLYFLVLLPLTGFIETAAITSQLRYAVVPTITFVPDPQQPLGTRYRGAYVTDIDNDLC
jgi:ubiquinol-cytochrome c reductase cytochrome b subunit